MDAYKKRVLSLGCIITGPLFLAQIWRVRPPLPDTQIDGRSILLLQLLGLATVVLAQRYRPVGHRAQGVTQLNTTADVTRSKFLGRGMGHVRHGTNEALLGPLVVSMKSGNEKFRINATPLEPSVLSFWKWGASDLVENTMRGVLAEFVVASALGLVRDQPRQSWSRFDLLTDDGLKIEVKSAAYLQSWAQKELSSVSFRYGAKLGWDPQKGFDGTPSRYADIYVFALLAHQHKSTVDPLDLEQWRFYVATTEAIAKRTRSQYAISLKSLEDLCNGADLSWQGPVEYLRLQSTIHAVAATPKPIL